MICRRREGIERIILMEAMRRKRESGERKRERERERERERGREREGGFLPSFCFLRIIELSFMMQLEVFISEDFNCHVEMSFIALLPLQCLH